MSSVVLPRQIKHVTMIRKLPGDMEKSIILRPIKWKLRKDGKTVGSTYIDFPSREIATNVFRNLPAAKTGCGGSNRSGPCFHEGWPGRNSFMHKLVRLFNENFAPSIIKIFISCILIAMNQQTVKALNPYSRPKRSVLRTLLRAKLYATVLMHLEI